MKRLSLVFAVLLMAGVVLAGQAAQEGKAKGNSHQVKVEVVSVDASKNTLTFKRPDGQEMTSPVEDAGRETLASLSPGDKVTLTCQDDANGEHKAIVAIEKDPVAAKP